MERANWQLDLNRHGIEVMTVIAKQSRNDCIMRTDEDTVRERLHLKMLQCLTVFLILKETHTLICVKGTRKGTQVHVPVEKGPSLHVKARCTSKQVTGCNLQWKQEDR